LGTQAHFSFQAHVGDVPQEVKRLAQLRNPTEESLARSFPIAPPLSFRSSLPFSGFLTRPSASTSSAKRDAAYLSAPFPAAGSHARQPPPAPSLAALSHSLVCLELGPHRPSSFSTPAPRARPRHLLPTSRPPLQLPLSSACRLPASVDANDQGRWWGPAGREAAARATDRVERRVTWASSHGAGFRRPPPPPPPGAPRRQRVSCAQTCCSGEAWRPAVRARAHPRRTHRPAPSALPAVGG
jgi:hypothetical protein